ncbi:MAG TPA: SDR family oxidoreductase [Chryseolinea sp.]|nr:SDR family oxidoreductase [Chryseolinea sp.]
MKSSRKHKARKRQSIERSAQGKERKLKPVPVVENLKKTHRLAGKVAIITGADSGIGKAIALMYAKEGADLVLTYYKDRKDARQTSQRVKELGARHILLQGDVSDENHCKRIVKAAIDAYKKLDIVINNAAVQYPQDKLSKITKRQIQRTFEVNIFSHLYLVKAAEKFLKKGASLIHTTSVTAYRGSSHLIDYAATKGAIVSLLRSLSSYFADKGIRVNGVAPGPVWTPLIATTFKPKEVATFGTNTPLGRAGQPVEIAHAYVFLGSDESSYITGQVIHPNGGEIINT